MRSIGFDNFRRYKKLDPLSFAPITIFVGGNNSGKSTVVKGILSVLEFFQKQADLDSVDEGEINDENSNEQINNRDFREWLSHNQRFRFNTNYFAHIGTFKRALWCESESKEIAFRYSNGNWIFKICVKMDENNDEATSGKVTRIVALHRFLMKFNFDLEEWSAAVTFKHDDPERWDERADIANENNRRFYERLAEYCRLVPEDMTLTFNLPDKIGTNHAFVMSDLISALIDTVEDMFNDGLRDYEDEGDGKDDRLVLDDETRGIIKTHPFYSERFERLGIPAISPDKVEYIYAHAVTQSIIYSAKDTNDYLVKTVHDFASRRIHGLRGERASLYKFIIKWMKEFEIGMDYKVESVGGEAHTVKIKNGSGNWVNLADMGMGSIQLMILLFRIATILDDSKISRTVILEEPEQNLHPKLQSKLADLLFEINQKFGLRFIVETHSEYLIRKTQVLVGENFNTTESFKKNPFKVYYFPSDGHPYDMVYKPTGEFQEPFGDGFFDEAARLYMTVLQNANK